MMGSFIIGLLSIYIQVKECSMIQFQVNDMTCGHCVATITKAVKALDGAARVDIDLATHRVNIESVQPGEMLEKAIRAAGYSPETQQ